MTAHARASLHFPFEHVRNWVTASALYEGRGSIADTGDIHLQFGHGRVRLAPDGADTALHVEAEDAAGLQMLRDFATDTAREAGLLPEWHGEYQIGRPANFCLGRVTSVARISPRYRRITLEGAGLTRLMTGGLHFRLLLGPKGAPWPETDASGLTVWPEGKAQWHNPVYTVRDIRASGPMRITFDVFLHDGGRVTEWSETLSVGAEVGLLGPSGGDIPEATGWTALYGDETALPAIARILAALPGDVRGKAVILVPGADDRQDLPRPKGVRLDWLYRDRGDDLATAFEGLTVPASDRFVFFAASRSEAARARRHCEALGLGRKEFWAQAYWQD